MSGPRGCALRPRLHGVLGVNDCRGLHLLCGHRGQRACPEVGTATWRGDSERQPSGGPDLVCGTHGEPWTPTSRGSQETQEQAGAGQGRGRGAGRGGAAGEAASSRLLGVADAAAAAHPGSPLSRSLGPEWLKGGFFALCAAPLPQLGWWGLCCFSPSSRASGVKPAGPVQWHLPQVLGRADRLPVARPPCSALSLGRTDRVTQAFSTCWPGVEFSARGQRTEWRREQPHKRRLGDPG